MDALDTVRAFFSNQEQDRARVDKLLMDTVCELAELKEGYEFPETVETEVKARELMEWMTRNHGRIAQALSWWDLHWSGDVDQTYAPTYEPPLAEVTSTCLTFVRRGLLYTGRKSLLEEVSSLLEGVNTYDKRAEIPFTEIGRVDKIVLTRAAEIAREIGGYEKPSTGPMSGEVLGAWACTRYPEDAKAISWWDSIMHDEMDDSDMKTYVPKAYDDARTWQVIVDNGVEAWLEPKLPDVDVGLMDAAFAMLEEQTNKRKRDDRETAEQKRSTVPADISVPHWAGKHLDSPVFHLEPPTLEMLNVNVHDHILFREARKWWMGGSDAPKLCGNPWNVPDVIIAILRGEKKKPAVDLRGWILMCMGHDGELVALAAFVAYFACVLTDSAFFPIPGTMMVITPDSILRAENAGDRLAKFFQPPFSSIQPVEVKSHAAGIKDPAPKRRRRDGKLYYPHEATFIQACLQWFAVNETNHPAEGMVPSFFLVDHYPDGQETCAWHVSFPDPQFYTQLFAHLERCRLALLADEAPHVPKITLPHHTVVCERIM